MHCFICQYRKTIRFYGSLLQFLISLTQAPSYWNLVLLIILKSLRLFSCCCKTHIVLAWRRGEVLPITTVIEGGVSLSETVLGTCGGKKRVIGAEGDVGLWDNFPWNCLFDTRPSLFSSSIEFLYLFETVFVFLLPEKNITAVS